VLSDPAVTDRARDACEPALGRWISAARYGLADRVLQRSAVTVFELALSALAPLDAPSWLVGELTVALERGVRRGLCPADRAGPAPRPPAAGGTAHAGGTSPAGPADVPEEARA
jgi:glutamate--cysteine ligase